MILSGCYNNQEKVKHTNSKQLVQSETEDKENKIENNNVQNIIEEDIDLSNVFNKINGCAVLYNPLDNKYFFYNKSMSKQQVSPYSTFKIFSTLSGLHNGIIRDETSTMNYNGTEYSNPNWNENLTLQEAFQTSCIWYFRQVIDAIGKDKVSKELNELVYGNSDISEWEGSNVNPYKELNGFWLNSSLKISPFEQIQVLTKIFEGQSIYSNNNIKILKKVMLIQDNQKQQIYGKTGSNSNGEAWFVGFIEEDEQVKYFAIYLNDSLQKEKVSSSMAKEIALKILETIFIE